MPIGVSVMVVVFRVSRFPVELLNSNQNYKCSDTQSKTGEHSPDVCSPVYVRCIPPSFESSPWISSRQTTAI